MKYLFRFLITGFIGLVLVFVGIWAYAGSYGVHVLIRHGGTFWINVATDDPRLSPAMRLALRAAPTARAGHFEWHEVAPGFDVAELPVIAGDTEVDRIFLARVDPERFRFEVRNASSGDKDLDQWMSQIGAALVINGSYYSQYGVPDTPLLSSGRLLGPRDYNAKAGAFISSATSADIRDLAHEDWRVAFHGADNAMVSYPLLISESHENRVIAESRWLANRSFVGTDKAGRIVLGTTSDAFFSLARFAEFLRAAPLDLVSALNLDGGPVACQGISLGGFERKSYGKWELQAQGSNAQLLTWPYGTIAMPVILAVFAK